MALCIIKYNKADIIIGIISRRKKDLEYYRSVNNIPDYYYILLYRISVC